MSPPDSTVIREWLLLVEDDADSREAMRLVLEDSGYAVTTADSGRAGLAALDTRPWDAVILDLRLPDLSGLEVLRAIKAASSVIPVILVTGQGSMASAVSAVNEAAFAYLEKPVSLDRLLDTVGRALATHRSEENRRHLAAIVEGSEDAIIGKSLDGNILTWNRAAGRLYGYAAGEMIGNSIAVLMPPELPDELALILGRLRRGERIENYETVRVRKDGSRVDVSLTISPLRDADGTVTGASAIARDITRRKRAEAARRALIRLGRELVESLELAEVAARVVALVRDFFRVRRVTLFRRHPASGAMVAVATAGDAGPDGRLDAESLAAGLSVPLVDRGETLGGLTLADDAGRLFTAGEQEVLFAFADQTALAIRNAGLFEEVLQQRDFLRSVTENSADAIVTTDVRARVTYLSAGAVRMFGYEPAEVLGRRVARYCRRGRAEAWAMARRLAREGELRDYETALHARDGSWVPVSASVSLLRDAQGRVVGALGVIRDVTDREAADAARREASALRTVTLLAGGVAHEVNNPLAVVVGQLELLALGEAPGSPAAIRIQRALAAAQDIRDIVGRLAKITRIETAVTDKLPPILDIRRSAADAG